MNFDVDAKEMYGSVHVTKPLKLNFTEISSHNC